MPGFRPVHGPDSSAADELPAQARARIVKLDALRQQLQRRAEIVVAHLYHVGIQRITRDWHPQRRNVHPQSWGRPGFETQPVQPARGYQLIRAGDISPTRVSALAAPGSQTICRLPPVMVMRLPANSGSTKF